VAEEGWAGGRGEVAEEGWQRRGERVAQEGSSLAWGGLCERVRSEWAV